jgi:hypothetical protein
VTFSITLHENGQVVLSYRDANGFGANAGIEDATGTQALQFVDSSRCRATQRTHRPFPAATIGVSPRRTKGWFARMAERLRHVSLIGRVARPGAGGHLGV